MENGVFTRQQVVDEYASEGQKNHFAKNNRFKVTHMEVAFHKILESKFYYYEKIRKEGKICYELGKKKEIPDEIPDGRKSNGNWGIYTKNLDIIILLALQKKNFYDESLSLSQWANELNILTLEQYNIYRGKYHPSLYRQAEKKAIENNAIKIGEESIFNQYNHIIRDLVNQCSSSLNRLKKIHLINFTVEIKGVVNGNVINIDEFAYNKIRVLKKQLLEKHNITDFKISMYSFSKDVVEYNKEFYEQLSLICNEDGEILNLERYFESYRIQSNIDENSLRNYLQEFKKEDLDIYIENPFLYIEKNIKEFKIGRIKKIEEKATKTMRDFKKPYVRKKVKETQKIFGGKLKIHTPSRYDNKFEVDFHALYFDEDFVDRILNLEKLFGFIYED